MKFTGYMSPAFVMMKEIYPDAKYIFMTRRFKPTMASHRSVIDAQSALGRLLGELHEVGLNEKRGTWLSDTFLPLSVHSSHGSHSIRRSQVGGMVEGAPARKEEAFPGTRSFGADIRWAGSWPRARA